MNTTMPTTRNRPLYYLNNWRILDNRLIGKVYNHPNFDNGTVIKTSNIVSREDDKVTTYSGSVYILLTEL